MSHVYSTVTVPITNGIRCSMDLDKNQNDTLRYFTKVFKYYYIINDNNTITTIFIDKEVQITEQYKYFKDNS